MAKKWRSKSLFGEMESLFGEMESLIGEMESLFGEKNGEENGEVIALWRKIGEEMATKMA